LRLLNRFVGNLFGGHTEAAKRRRTHVRRRKYGTQP
jgi:hypothetical protein